MKAHLLMRRFIGILPEGKTRPAALLGGICLALVITPAQGQIDTTYSNSGAASFNWNNAAEWTKTGPSSDTVPQAQNHKADITNTTANRRLTVDRDGIHLGEFLYNAGSTATLQLYSSGTRSVVFDKMVKRGTGALHILEAPGASFSVEVGNLDLDTGILELGFSSTVSLTKFEVTGSTRIASGAQIRNSSGKTLNLGNLDLAAASAGARTSTRNINGAIEVTSLTGTGVVELDNSLSATATRGDFILNNSNVSPVTFSGVLRNGTSGTLHVTKQGSGTQQLGGINTYTGLTTISAGTLLLSGNGSINTTSTIEIDGGTFTQNSSTTVTAPITLAAGTISGSGRIDAALAIGANQTVSPGNGVGSQTYGTDQTWLADGNFNLQILDADGIAGVGYDTLNILGQLDLEGLSAGNRFNINLWSLSAPDTNGNALNFANTQSYQFAILTAQNGILIDDSSTANDYFTINISAVNGTGGFSNALDGGGFSVSIVDNTVYLNYSAIPEPASALLVVLSALLLGGRRSRPVPRDARK